MGELASNVGVVRRLLEAFNERDDDTVLDLVHPEVEWVPGPPEPYRGREEIRRYLGDARSAELRMETTQMRARGETVVVLGQAHVRGTDAVPLALVWQIRDGRAAHGEALPPDAPIAEPAAPEPFLIELPAVPESVPVARDAVTEWASRLGGGSADLLALQICVSEATTNVVLHAYVNVEPGAVRVSTGVRDDEVVLRVEDDGRGMVPHPESPGLGMGLPLMGRMAASLGIVSSPERERGCAVEMLFRSAHTEGVVEAGDPTRAESCRS